MKSEDYTDIGGTGGTFLTTHWSIIDDVKSQEDKDKALIGLLLKKYWKPVYCYLRRKGYDNEQAKDLTQSFFHEVVLGRGLIEKADKARGRFRSFLLISLNRFLINVKRQESAQKRIPPDKLVSLDTLDSIDLPQSIANASPDEAFNYAWVTTLIEQVLNQVKDQCYEDGKTTHWHIFYDRILEPIMDGIEAPALSDICDKYGTSDESKVSNMIVTVRRRFQGTLRQHLRNLVISDEQINEELVELRKFFPKIAQDDE